MTIYQEELKRRLKEQGYGAVYDEKSEMLKIYHNGVFLCDQGKNGELVYDSKIINEPYYSQFTQKIFEEASEIKECARLYENGLPMKVESVSNYHKFLEYGDTVLAGAYNKKRGFQFATWWQTEGGAYLAYGHYTDSFTKAKEDFAIRAKLVDGNKVFTADQAELIFKSVNYARDECGHITYEQDQEMDGIMERLVHGYPEKDFSVMNTHFEPSENVTQNQ